MFKFFAVLLAAAIAATAHGHNLRRATDNNLSSSSSELAADDCEREQRAVSPQVPLLSAPTLNEKSHADRELFVCGLIEDFFNDTVSCSCDLTFSSSAPDTVGFTCKNVNEACFAGLCFKPSYAGTFLYDIAVSDFEFKGKVCALDTNSLASPIGDLQLGNFCIEAGFKISRDATSGDIQTGISTCKAEAFNIKCDSCTPCPLAGGNSTGVSLKCSNIPTASCIPLNLPLSTASNVVSGKNFFDGIGVEEFVHNQIMEEEQDGATEEDDKPNKDEKEKEEKKKPKKNKEAKETEEKNKDNKKEGDESNGKKVAKVKGVKKNKNAKKNQQKGKKGKNKRA